MKIDIHGKGCVVTKDVDPKWTHGKIHIYRGCGGYKLSIGNRHLTLAELVSVVNLYNSHQI